MPARTTAVSHGQLSATRGADASNQDAQVDRVADQVVRAAGHQLWLVLLGHRGAPVASDVDAGPDRKSQPESEDDEPEAGAPRIRVEAVVAEGSQADQEDHDDK